MSDKLILTIDKPFIYMQKPNDDNRIRYDLKNKQFEKLYPKKGWCEVKNQYKYLSGISISNVKFEDEKFKKLFNISARLQTGNSSLSTFIINLPAAFTYEGYIQEGIEFEMYTRRESNWGATRVCVNGVTQPLTLYPKNVIKFFKKHNIQVNRGLEKAFVQNKKTSTIMIEKINAADLDDESVNDFLGRCFDRYSFARVSSLIDEYNFDLMSLIKYVYEYLTPFENLEFTRAISLLSDYCRMAKAIGRKVKKYPKYLHSMHDIITSNYNAYKREYAEDIFKSMQHPELEHEDKQFCIINPETSKDVIQEGVELNHCVSSYVDKIINGSTNIIFLRKTKDKESSLITLEYKNKAIVQARGAYNRSLTADEKSYLEKYCKSKKLECVV